MILKSADIPHFDILALAVLLQPLDTHQCFVTKLRICSDWAIFVNGAISLSLASAWITICLTSGSLVLL